MSIPDGVRQRTPPRYFSRSSEPKPHAMTFGLVERHACCACGVYLPGPGVVKRGGKSGSLNAPGGGAHLFRLLPEAEAGSDEA
eukprot:scaffold29938_cov118-Isochrysis_galbana.AAC.4